MALIQFYILLFITSLVQTPTLNKENVLAELHRQDVHHAHIVLAQSIHETGNYTSQLCRKHNNLFGIRRNGKYVHYNDWTESITSYKKLIQSKYRKGEDYYSFLKRIRYAEDSRYIQKIKKYI